VAVQLQRSLLYFPMAEYLSTPDVCGLPFEDVQLRCTDGVQLHSWFIKAAPSFVQPASVATKGPTVVLFHGVRILFRPGGSR